MDTALPFGLRSAPKIFNALADAIQFIAQRQGVPWITHYFLLLGKTETEECSAALDQFHKTCTQLGVPLAPGKTHGPATTIEFLGIIFDTDRMILALPELKKQEKEIGD